MLHWYDSGHKEGGMTQVIRRAVCYTGRGSVMSTVRFTSLIPLLPSTEPLSSASPHQMPPGAGLGLGAGVGLGAEVGPGTL